MRMDKIKYQRLRLLENQALGASPKQAAKIACEIVRLKSQISQKERGRDLTKA